MFNRLLPYTYVFRLFYDFCRDKYWCKAVQNKIQNKIATLHLPTFVETLELSAFEIGTQIPKILKVYEAVVDEWGIWLDFEIKYEGNIKLMIETKLNLVKMKNTTNNEQHAFVNGTTTDHYNSVSGSPEGSAAYPTFAFPQNPAKKMEKRRGRYSDDEMPESPETSPDEDFGTKQRLDSQP